MKLLSPQADNISNSCKLLLLLLLFTAINNVIGFSIGSPTPNTRIQVGAQFLVTWSDLTGNVTTVTVELAQGSQADAVMIKATLASNAPAGGGSTTVSTPTTILPASNYYIRVKSNGNPASAAVQGPYTFFTSTTSGDSSGVQPKPTSSFSLILPRPSSASLSHSSSAIGSGSVTSKTPSGTSSSTAEETSNSSDIDDSKDEAKDSNGNKKDENAGLSGGAIAGIAVGGVAGALAIFGVMMCVRRSGRDGDERVDASSEIYSSPPGYHAETKDTTMAAIPATVHQHRQEYSSTSPRHEHTTQQGNFYPTGYETGYYNNNTTTGTDPYYQQQQQGGYDQYNNYGYHPSAVYMPNIAHGHEQQQYQGYDNNQYYAHPQQPYPPQPVYYNNSPPIPQQPQQEPPHSPTNPQNH
ncbi:hypothetical protein BDC45DRAFT_244751 [Circinella umbellata]|nr:hypothetical protein BDC45DRAFT_244751 [Circinella umbellata]